MELLLASGHQHQIVTIWIGAEALINVVTDERGRSSFPAYLKAISAQDAEILRDELFAWRVSPEGVRLSYVEHHGVDEPKTLLESRQAFAAHFLLTEKSQIDAQIGYRFYDLLNDPPALKSLIVDYLNYFGCHGC